MNKNNNKRIISQEAFDAMVTENISILSMDPSEALQDAIDTLTLQHVDISGILKSLPGSTTNPLLQSLHRLNTIILSSTDNADEEMLQLLDKITDLLCDHQDNTAIAVRNGGVQLFLDVCSDRRSDRTLCLGLKALGLVLRDLQSREMFRQCDGPRITVDIIGKGLHNYDILGGGFGVVAAAATANEVIKELFMELKVDELILQSMRVQSNKGLPQSLFDAIRVLLTPDDDRVLASQVFGYARRFAKLGIANPLIDAIREGQLNTSSLISACTALKVVAANDEICRSISENGGIDAIFQCIDGSGGHNTAIAKACCTLLSKLAGSDENKNAIVQMGGLDSLIKLSSRYSEDPSVLQEIMCIIGILSLRSPENAARAIEAGAGDLAIQAMQKFPVAYQMQRHSCLMIRNLASRNPENRTILLSLGIEKLIRKAKVSHQSCKEAATDALRDLGLDDYNA